MVQAGRGKYRDAADQGASEIHRAHVDIDACTFDRVLLYLEHEALGIAFQFDPLLASELLEAAQSLQLSGLQIACEKVLGSFQERVCRRPIRLEEVLARNAAGDLSENEAGGGAGAGAGGAGKVVGGNKSRRGDTLLIMQGMVFDITRWLPEHPGGSTIIPQQALGVDCTVFFEIYHASKQSLMYLKEFYIGELAREDLEKVPLPPGRATPSAAFLEQLTKYTSWRLDYESLTTTTKVHLGSR